MDKKQYWSPCSPDLESMMVQLLSAFLEGVKFFWDKILNCFNFYKGSKAFSRIASPGPVVLYEKDTFTIYPFTDPSRSVPSPSLLCLNTSQEFASSLSLFLFLSFQPVGEIACLLYGVVICLLIYAWLNVCACVEKNLERDSSIKMSLALSGETFGLFCLFPELYLHPQLPGEFYPPHTWTYPCWK